MTLTFDDLSDEQKSIVYSREPRILVLGGAGTGKTASALFAAKAELNHQAEQGDRPDSRVLILTFSRAATTRVLERAGGLLTAQESRRVEISTFHGLAYRIVNSFGRYNAKGRSSIDVQSSAENRLLGSSANRLTYDTLVTEAIYLLRSPMIGRIYRHRWDLIICDEFQDTSDSQWEILRLLGDQSRILLLGDPNQMIYQWLPGVGPHRLAAARAAGFIEIPLPRGSHRDPSQILPAAAEAILSGNYGSSAVQNAVAAGRLRIYGPVDAGIGLKSVRWQVAEQRGRSNRSIGVYVRENSFVHEVCTDLASNNVPHSLVGIPEARAHAIDAQLTLVMFASGQREWLDVCKLLAIFLVSVTRGKVPSEASFLLRGKASTATLADRLDEVRRQLTDPDLEAAEAFELARHVWRSLGFTSGQRSWSAAAATLGPLIARARGRSSNSIDDLERAVDEIRQSYLFNEDFEDDRIVQVMTINQTKGREFDSAIVWCRGDDYFGNYADWSVNGRRLLYVALTRARNEISVLLAPDAHQLWSPLLNLAQRPPVDP